MTTIYIDEWRKATPFSFITVIQRLDYVSCEHVVGFFFGFRYRTKQSINLNYYRFLSNLFIKYLKLLFLYLYKNAVDDEILFIFIIDICLHKTNIDAVNLKLDY